MKDLRELSVPVPALETLLRQGIQKATPVQEAAIPLIRKGIDTIVKAPTGTGKTLAFLLPLMERIKPRADGVQVLIVTPTRELTVQIAKVARELSRAFSVRVAALYGGQDAERQKERMRRLPQLIIGTPGRLLDHMRRGTLRLGEANRIVLDEADEMMKRGFIEDVEKLIAALAPDRQIILVSATIPDRVKALSRRYMRSPREVTVESERVTLDNITQTVIGTTEETKLNRLSLLINEKQPYLMMVFCMTRQRVHQVTTELIRRGYLADELHGELTQAQRLQVLRRFGAAKIQILVTTDIAARGLDIEGVSHVVNYDIPRGAEDYIHRIGRTGRAGRTGEAVTFVNARQYDGLRRIEAAIRGRIERIGTGRSSEKKKSRPNVRKEAAGKRKEKTGDAPKSVGKRADGKGACHGGRKVRSRTNSGTRFSENIKKVARRKKKR